MRMELADDIAHGARGLLVLGSGRKAQLAHRIDDAPLYRLQAVTQHRQRAIEDDVHRVIEVGLLGEDAQWLALDAFEVQFQVFHCGGQANAAGMERSTSLYGTRPESFRAESRLCVLADRQDSVCIASCRMARPLTSMFRRWFMWPLVALASLVVVLAAAVTGTAALVDGGYLHEPIRKLLVAKTSREIRVLGPVKIRLLSRHPSLTAEGVVIHNPPWMPAGILAEIGKVSLDLELPTLAEPLRLRRIELQSATFNLLRDASGKANWRATPGRQAGKGPPLIGSLAMPGAVVSSARRTASPGLRRPGICARRRCGQPADRCRRPVEYATHDTVDRRGSAGHGAA